MTPFMKRVYGACKKIPRGKVSTYKSLAESIGCRSAQAVGQVLKRNPLAPEVPCHRVIRSDLTLGGYGGEIQGKMLQKKIDLLEAEGVYFEKGRLKNLKVLYTFPTVDE